VLDRTVSLYSPTVTALRHGRRRDAPGPAGRREGRPLVLHCSAGSERHPKLPWAGPEASRVAARYAVSPVDTAALSRDELLAAIGACTDLHASMHARSDPVDPAHGALITGVDGDAESDSDSGVELTVTDIAARHNTAAGLAYLSACETTLGTPGLADEAVHLTGAFQLAGFRNVIGTYWAVRDAVADRASRWFYDALDRLGSPERAAHETALRLRGRYRGHPSAWAAHHCTGIGS
jgi:CHAT domain-containing protein